MDIDTVFESPVMQHAAWDALSSQLRTASGPTSSLLMRLRGMPVAQKRTATFTDTEAKSLKTLNEKLQKEARRDMLPLVAVTVPSEAKTAKRLKKQEWQQQQQQQQQAAHPYAQLNDQQLGIRRRIAELQVQLQEARNKRRKEQRQKNSRQRWMDAMARAEQRKRGERVRRHINDPARALELRLKQQRESLQQPVTADDALQQQQQQQQVEEKPHLRKLNDNLDDIRAEIRRLNSQLLSPQVAKPREIHRIVKCQHCGVIRNRDHNACENLVRLVTHWLTSARVLNVPLHTVMHMRPPHLEQRR